MVHRRPKQENDGTIRISPKILIGSDTLPYETPSPFPVTHVLHHICLVDDDKISVIKVAPDLTGLTTSYVP